ncbi:MAG: hypothetical protein GWP02_04995, partial [Desulfobulbaceae bacterium]|nr:hypothetical protein [Desulfobulbaceae bacterium]
MATNYVLIDFENVHPKNLELLTKHPFKVFVFVGASQTKVPFDLADSMQFLGNDARYIKISGNGQNALDFHIAYYIGELAGKDADAQFHIISKDKGFDPLIQHHTLGHITQHGRSGFVLVGRIIKMNVGAANFAMVFAAGSPSQETVTKVDETAQ